MLYVSSSLLNGHSDFEQQIFCLLQHREKVRIYRTLYKNQIFYLSCLATFLISAIFNQDLSRWKRWPVCSIRKNPFSISCRYRFQSRYPFRISHSAFGNLSQCDYSSTGTHRGSVFSLLSCGSSTLNSPSGTAVCVSWPSFLLVVNP